MPDRTCSIDGCERPSRKRGWCTWHYDHWYLYGDPLAERPRPSAAERFNAKWQLDPDTGCWRWVSSLKWSGYAMFRVGDRMLQGHRWSYEHHVGPIPEGLQLDHLCRNRACVNPAHLEPVTAQENQRRSGSVSGINAAKTECIRGHDLRDPDNVKVYGGRRHCVACRRLRDKIARQEGRKR